ncbi:unnamed protein product, partial [Pleuronectes platessa]
DGTIQNVLVSLSNDVGRLLWVQIVSMVTAETQYMETANTCSGQELPQTPTRPVVEGWDTSCLHVSVDDPRSETPDVINMLPGKDGQSPYVTCGAKREDSDKIGQLVYYPPNGTFNLMYYPYYGKKAQVNYTQPLVAVKFLNASLNTDISVECKINSNTLSPGSERDKFAGRVSFKLRINDK